MSATSASSPARHIRSLVAGFDILIRRSHGAVEFTSDPACILRLALARAHRRTVLADGTCIEPGDPLAEIHLWNERLPQMPREGADLAWARRMYAGFVASLRLVARHLAADPKLGAARALYGESGFLTTSALDAGVGAIARLGFEIRRPRAQAGAWGRFVELWPSLYSYAILWTFNPASLRRKPLLGLERCEVWMSRRTLDGRYAAAQPRTGVPG